MDNPFWNGFTIVAARLEATPIRSLDELPISPEGTVLALVPYEPFSNAELERLKEHVIHGGALMLLDDYGHGNQVLSHLAVEMRFAGKPLLDPLFNHKNRWLPKITGFEKGVMGNVESVVLNHASSLNNTGGATVVAWSSRFGFLDLNEDSGWTPGEPTGPLPVAAYVKVGEGYLIVVSDPSLLINGMIDMEDNLSFTRILVKLRPPGANTRILIDQSHVPKTALDDAKETLKLFYGVVSSPLGTLGLVGLILVVTLKPLWSRGGNIGG